MKVLINRCFGGFGLSRAVADVLNVQNESDDGAEYDIADALGLDVYAASFRTDPRIVTAVEAVIARGDSPSATYAMIVVIEIPDDVNWFIDEHDGMEVVREHHRRWYY